MLERAVKELGAGAMRSPVNWAVLGLTIERPSYGYEILQRFERNYGELLKLSSPSQIYTGLDSLVERKLIEATSEPPPGAASRQPRLHYRATEDGVRRYQEHLIGQAEEGRRRASLFTRELAALAPDAALAVLEHYEQICLSRAASPRTAHAGPSASEPSASLADRLAAEEDRLALEAKLPWIEYARRELRAALERDRHGPA
ncbi:MAG TPA: helix-turn-helix transcriptional regulator [Solirubrobacteraceae bacterium]|jgi:DNA-binding PadR family transcriptional regulator|nr:helix-turn-helix transcriptional regulator [Solirubrobacteraceae bacterium]